MTEYKAELLQVLEGHLNDVTWCDFSGSNLVTGSNDKTVKVWLQKEHGNFEEIPTSPFIGHTYGVNCVRFSPFGTIIASCSTDGMIILWNAQTGEKITHFSHPSGSAVRICCFSPSSSLLASGGDDEKVVLWDISTRSAIRILEGHEATVMACAFSPDSCYLLSGSCGGELKLWDSRYGHGKCLFTCAEAHDLGVSCCDFSPQYEVNTGGDLMSTIYIFASCGNDDLVKLWQLKAGSKCSLSLYMTLKGHSANVMCCQFSNDGHLLASSAGDKMVLLRDAQTGKILLKLEGHSRYITCCSFSANTKLIATSSNDKTAMVWKLTPCSNVKDDPSNPSSISCLYMGPSNGVHAISHWPVENVCIWLEGLGLKEYVETFRIHAIDGKELLHLTHETLMTVLKIDAFGHRSKILRGIQAVKNPLWQHQTITDESSIFPEFCCPITHEKMIDPVVAADGYSYERAAICEWIKSGKSTSPMTNEELQSTVVTPNNTLRIIIQKHQE